MEKLVKRVTTHGISSDKLYKVWSSMKSRCTNPTDQSYCNYGGRGISICEAWQSFEPFREWAFSHGYRRGLTIERINNDGNYSPENCKWIPKGRQSDNTRRCTFITMDGKTQNMKQWAKELGIPYSLVQSRIKHGWDPVEALRKPSTDPSRCNCTLITYAGKTQNVREWADELGVNYKTLHRRLADGWTVERAFNSDAEAFKKKVQEATGVVTYIA